MPDQNTTKTRRLTGTRIGVVTSAKRDKTRTIAVEYQKVHAKYGKRLRRQAKYHVHDEDNQSRLGDRVEIAECRPLSKTKSWRLIRVVVKAPDEVAQIAD